MTVQGQDQAVKPEEVTEEVKAGEEKKAVETAAIEQSEDTGLITKEEGVSIEDIMSSDTDKKTEREINQEAVNKRISKVVGEKKVAENRARVAEEKVKQLETERLAPVEKPMVPDRDVYETTEEYQTAYDDYQTKLYAWNNAQANIETQARDKQVRDKANSARYVEQAEQLKKKFPDVYDVIGANDYGNAQQAIADSEHSVRIGYFLAKNPSENFRIGSLTDEATINREIGKLEAKFSTTKNVSKTNAPPPLETVKGDSEDAPADIYKIKDSNEWFRARQRQRRGELTKTT